MFAALARLGARLTAVVMTLEAVFTVALATLLLGEPLNARQAIGGAGVLAATIVVARIRSAAPPQARVPARGPAARRRSQLTGRQPRP